MVVKEVENIKLIFVPWFCWGAVSWLVSFDVVGKEQTNIYSKNDQNWSGETFGTFLKAPWNSEEHKAKVEENNQDTKNEPPGIKTIPQIGGGMFEENWEIMQNACFKSTNSETECTVSP